MNAPAKIDGAAAEPIAWMIDLIECPLALDENGRAGWWQVLGLEAHVLVTRLMAANRELRAERMPYCDTCGARPCRFPSFCSACRRADESRKRSRRR